MHHSLVNTQYRHLSLQNSLDTRYCHLSLQNSQSQVPLPQFQLRLHHSLLHTRYCHLTMQLALGQYFVLPPLIMHLCSLPLIVKLHVTLDVAGFERKMIWMWPVLKGK
uniref:Uncharacterized protein n=1 Tax=Cacopsylla melanoneura TaxID=428564 RepID=A0A8D8X4A5_9HEMI